MNVSQEFTNITLVKTGWIRTFWINLVCVMHWYGIQRVCIRFFACLSTEFSKYKTN